MIQSGGVVEVERQQVEQILNCPWSEIRARIREGQRDPVSGAITHNSVLGEFENGARLVSRKGQAGRQFLIMPKGMHGREAEEIGDQLKRGFEVRLKNGGNA